MLVHQVWPLVKGPPISCHGLKWPLNCNIIFANTTTNIKTRKSWDSEVVTVLSLQSLRYEMINNNPQYHPVVTWPAHPLENVQTGQWSHLLSQVVVFIAQYFNLPLQTQDQLFPWVLQIYNHKKNLKQNFFYKKNWLKIYARKCLNGFVST